MVPDFRRDDVWMPDQVRHDGRCVCGQTLNSPEGVITGFNGLIQILLRMGQRNEPGLELGRRKINTLLHHLDKELGKSLGIAQLGSLIILDRTLGKKEGEYPSGLIDGKRNSLFLRPLRNVFCQIGRLLI